ncbi:MAG: TonB-dependent receptor [Bacteroidales bacterium]|nr:TonB-dependent receptor [Bacteroidales bacterium]
MKKTVFVFYFLLTSIFLFAQDQIIVKGKVTDESNIGIPGVSIAIKGTALGTITDLNGDYEINALSNATLVFSSIGFTTQEILVNNRENIDVALLESTELVDEVVVIGYGKVKKSDLTGSVSSVKGEDITKISSLNAEQSLQGMATGVQVTSTSGAPGAVPVIRIRGVGTFNNSSPIFIVDGIILDDISFLSSGDISSMEVLKDASATAMYGSRGANGVIIVSTKQGNTKDKVVINYSGEYGTQFLAKKIDLLNGREFGIITNEINPGTYSNVDALPNTDWQDLVFKPAAFHNHQISFSGSTEMSQFYFGVSYLKQDGIIDKSSYERLSFKINNTYNLFKNLKIGNHLTISPYKQQIAPNVTYSVYRAQPLLPPYYADGSYGVVYNVGNPLANLANSNNFNKGLRAVGNVFAEAEFLEAFTVKSSFGIDGSYNKAENFTPAYTVYNPDGTASQQNNEFNDLYKGNNQNLTWLWENTISYLKDFNKHTIDFVGGYTMQQSNSEYFGISGENLIRDYEDLWYITPASVYDPTINVNTIQSISNGVDQYYSMISYLARVNYTFDNRYIFTATFRRDGSSKFAKEKRYGSFPSFALGWNISNESFMQGIDLINNLKLRASWGKIGNDKVNYLGRFSTTSSGLTIFGIPETANIATTYGKSGNPDLKWETTTQYDIGMEITILNNLSAEFDYYNRKTEDILIELSTPGYLGNGQGQKIAFNAASVLNTGLEAKINWRQRIDEFNYSIGVLFSTVHNEVLSIGGNSGIDSLLQGGYLGDGRSVTQSREGLPIGAFYGYKTDGIFQTQQELDAYPHSSQAGIGDLRFVDVNNDGVIDGNDRTNIGSSIPKFIFGLNIGLDYKAFDFALDISGQSGNDIFNGKEVVRPDPYNFEKHVFDRWTGPNTSNTEPRPSFGGYNFTPSDRFIQDGSFVRLRTLMLGYTLPEQLTTKFHVQKLRIYAKGNNLFTLTKFTGYTPEIGSGDVLSNGIDFGIYPITAIYSFGVNVTF